MTATVLALEGTHHAFRRALAQASGDLLVLVRAGANVAPADLTPEALADTLRLLDDASVAAAQPVVLAPSGLVASAGAVFRAGVVTSLLGQHHPRDLPAAPVDVPALHGPVIVARRGDVVAVIGRGRHAWRPGLPFSQVDLSLRLAARGRLVLQPDTRISLVVPSRDRPLRRRVASRLRLEERWGSRRIARRWAPLAGSGAAWRAVGFEADGLRPIVSVTEGTPRLRWTIDIASPAGPRAAKWGDTHFAQSLADALERRGQHVAIDNREMRNRPTRALDDVLLVLRGLHDVVPTPGPVSLQWIISHPDMVSPEEAARYDAVFAASSSWARWATDTWGVPVTPLLQCTDPALFAPDRRNAALHHDVLFVGNSRGVRRPAVSAALAAGADLTLIGSDWELVLPEHTPFAPLVANDELGVLYASAGVVLNDHHEDMRRDGFISNRLFDAAASGARVISDEVAGIREVFGDQVQVFRTDADMARLLATRDVFPDDATLQLNAGTIRREHSFDARAEALLAAALRLSSAGQRRAAT